MIQRIILIVTTLIIVLMVLFPPITTDSEDPQYEFVFGHRVYEKHVDGELVKSRKTVYSKFHDIEKPQLFMQIAILLIIAALLVLTFKEKQPRSH